MANTQQVVEIGAVLTTGDILAIVFGTTTFILFVVLMCIVCRGKRRGRR